MELSPREATDLARFFARRFPQREETDALARAAGVALDDTLAGDQVAVWSTLIVEAQVQGRLRRLARAAARSDQQDENLQEVCALLARGEGPSRGALLAGSATIVAILAFAGGAWLGLQPAEPPAATPAPEPAVSEAAPPPAPAPVVLVEPASNEPEPPTTAPAAPVEPTPAKTASIAPAATPTPSASSRCGGNPGEIVGYWYAGRTSPGTQGQTITITQAANVRADYPDKHNGYDARAPLRCGLMIGDRVHLSQAPIQVPGDAWWVPLAAGDLQ